MTESRLPTLLELLRELRSNTVEVIYQSLFSLHATGRVSAPAVPMLFGLGGTPAEPQLYTTIVLDASQMPETVQRLIHDHTDVHGVLTVYLSPEGVVTTLLERGGAREAHLYPITAHAFGVDLGEPHAREDLLRLYADVLA